MKVINVVANKLSCSQSELEEIRNVFSEAKSIEDLRNANQDKMRRLLKVGEANEVSSESKDIVDLFKKITITEELKAICELLSNLCSPSTSNTFSDIVSGSKTSDGREHILIKM
jgi:hypothetical protein